MAEETAGIGVQETLRTIADNLDKIGALSDQIAALKEENKELVSTLTNLLPGM